MKAATIQEIKAELSGIPPEELMSICLRLAKFKLENKELISYMLFDASNEPEYIRQVKEQVEEDFK